MLVEFCVQDKRLESSFFVIAAQLSHTHEVDSVIASDIPDLRKFRAILFDLVSDSFGSTRQWKSDPSLTDASPRSDRAPRVDLDPG